MKFTEEQIEFIKSNMKRRSCKWIGEKLGKSGEQIRLKIYQLKHSHQDPEMLYLHRKFIGLREEVCLKALTS